MPVFPSIRRVILVVLDGLRADAPARHRMPHLASLLEAGAWTLSGRTVRPSVTAAAMTSLFTGVSPEIHGLRSDRFALPRAPVRPLPALLRGHGLATHGFMAQIPVVHRLVAARIAHRLGAATTFRGRSAAEILAAAQGTIARERTGLIVFHWPDADRAGHAAGWHSGAYAVAVSRLDQALGSLRALAGLDQDPGTMLLVCSDHGGGGRAADDHDSDHPDDTTIPIVLAGAGVRAGPLGSASLLDIPATTLWTLGVPVPGHFGGRPLTEAFREPAAHPAAA